MFPWRELAQQGIGAARSGAGEFYINGRPHYQQVDTAALLDLLARYGYEVPENSTPAQQNASSWFSRCISARSYGMA